MSKLIRISDEVAKVIAEYGDVFDTPDTALRRIFKRLGVEVESQPSSKPHLGEKITSRYHLAAFILATLLQSSTKSLSAKETIRQVGQQVELTPEDKGKLRGGDVRWEKNVNFARAVLVTHGYLANLNDVWSRGFWKLTPKGAAIAQKLKKKEITIEDFVVILKMAEKKHRKSQKV